MDVRYVTIFGKCNDPGLKNAHSSSPYINWHRDTGFVKVAGNGRVTCGAATEEEARSLFNKTSEFLARPIIQCAVQVDARLGCKVNLSTLGHPVEDNECAHVTFEDGVAADVFADGTTTIMHVKTMEEAEEAFSRVRLLITSNTIITRSMSRRFN